ncbi:MAG: SDR family oxidoreductase [Chloroflexi bacterium]|nr:SDR family oxidoreductase [Chloroflexota bacterium]
MRLKDKVAIITGAGSGIGRATALLFAREGAKVVVADLAQVMGEETVRAIRGEGGEAIFVQVDVSRAADAERMVGAAIASYGRLDILFNNAGINLLGRVTETTEEDWDKVIAVNLKGVFLCSKYALLEMIKQGSGVIINASSAAGIVGLRNLAAYTASKGGVLQLTKNMALDYAPYNIRINALCPGVIETPMTEQVIESQADPAEARRFYERNRPLGRMGRPEEVAYAALYLASAEASYVTGAALPVDGGYTAQ